MIYVLIVAALLVFVVVHLCLIWSNVYAARSWRRYQGSLDRACGCEEEQR